MVPQALPKSTTMARRMIPTEIHGLSAALCGLERSCFVGANAQSWRYPYPIQQNHHIEGKSSHEGSACGHWYVSTMTYPSTIAGETHASKTRLVVLVVVVVVIVVRRGTSLAMYCLTNHGCAVCINSARVLGAL